MKKNQLLAIPLLLNGGLILPFLKKIYLNPFVMSLLIGFFGMNFVPSEKDDLYRHYIYFNLLDLKNYNPLVEKYFGLSIIMYLLKLLNLTKECLPLLSLFLFFYLHLNLVKKESKRYKLLKKKYVLILIYSIIVTGVPHLFIYSGIRFFLGSMFMVYGTLSYLRANNKIQAIAMFFLGISLHSYLILYLPILIFCILFKRKIIFDQKLRALYFLIIIYVSYNFEFEKIILLLKNYVKISSTYISNDTNYGVNGLKNTFLSGNIYGKIKFSIEILIYLVFPYLYMSKLKVKNKLDRFMVNYSYIALFLFKYYDLFRRYTYILGIFITYSLITLISRDKKIKIYILILILLKLILLIIHLISNKEFLILGLVNNMFSLNLLNVFSFE